MLNSLNINTANLKFDDNYMFLHDPALYLDFHDGSGQHPFGYLDAEKIWRQTVEYAIFKTGIPKSEIRRDVINQEFGIEATAKQIQPETIAIITQRQYDDSDTNFNRVIIGTELPAALFPSCVMVGKNVNGNEMRLYIRRLQITAEDLEITLGGDTHAGVKFKGTAQKDPTPLVTNPLWPYNPAKAAQDNIAFWAWAKPVGST